MAALTIGPDVSPCSSATILSLLNEETPESSQFFDRCWKLMGRGDVKPDELSFLQQISRVVFIPLNLQLKNQQPLLAKFPIFEFTWVYAC